MRLINADTLKAEFTGNFQNSYCSAEIKALIDLAPTIDPVKHAKWKYYHKQGIAVCTYCSFERNLDEDFGRAVSCPNCGAKMDLEV